ncbi:MAG: hypothetical protein MJY45_05325 [Bacteroidales bacterium]|nr:hypothetical protein [Bacteroidales bacterium]
MDKFFSELSFSELAGMVNSFPWFAAARAELARRSGRGAEAALYVGKRSLLRTERDSVDQREMGEIRSVISTPQERRVVVVGGDFFSQEQYDAVRREGDNIFRTFVSKVDGERGNTSPGEEEFPDYCTETLARVYTDQGYSAQAKDIYSKLMLRYPEKSAYFAALIEELDKQGN